MLEPLSDVVGFSQMVRITYWCLILLSIGSIMSHHFTIIILSCSWRLYHGIISSFHKCRDHFHHLHYLVFICHDDSISCIIWNHNLHIIIAMTLSSFASSYHHQRCIIWKHDLHIIIAMTLSSFASSYHHQRFYSLSFPHCIKHGTGVPGDFIIVFTFFAFQICSMLENTFLFPGSHPIVSLSQTIQLHLFSNYVEMFGKSNWPFKRESLSCVLQRLHVEVYELNEFDELLLVNA